MTKQSTPRKGHATLTGVCPTSGAYHTRDKEGNLHKSVPNPPKAAKPAPAQPAKAKE